MRLIKNKFKKITIIYNNKVFHRIKQINYLNYLKLRLFVYNNLF